MAYEHRGRPVAQDGGLLLEVHARGVQLGALPVPDADHEVPADEEVDLAGLDGVLLVDVPEGLEHEEDAVVVALELGPLVRVQGVLDGQRVQREDRRHVGQLALDRLVQTDPARSRRPARRRPGPGRGRPWRSSSGTRTPSRYNALSTIMPLRLGHYCCVPWQRSSWPDTAAPPRTRPGCWPGAPRGSASTTSASGRPGRPASGSPDCRWPRSSPARWSAAGRPRARSAPRQPTPLKVASERGLLECDYGDWTGRELKTLAKEPLWRDRAGAPERRGLPRR